MDTPNAPFTAINNVPMTHPSANLTVITDTNNNSMASPTHNTVTLAEVIPASTEAIPASTNLQDASNNNNGVMLNTPQATITVANLPGMPQNQPPAKNPRKRQSKKSIKAQEKTPKQKESLFVARARKDCFMNCSANQLMR
jgi:hypothetical protein